MNNAKGDDAAAGTPVGRREGVLKCPRQTHWKRKLEKLFDQLGIVDLKNNNFLSFGPVKVVVFLFKRRTKQGGSRRKVTPFPSLLYLNPQAAPASAADRNEFDEGEPLNSHNAFNMSYG